MRDQENASWMLSLRSKTGRISILLNVSALCEEAGTSRTTFYKYFGSVNDVADSVMDRMLDRASPF